MLGPYLPPSTLGEVTFLPHFTQRETQAQRGSEGREGSWSEPRTRLWGVAAPGPTCQGGIGRVPPEVSLGEKGEASGTRLCRCVSRPLRCSPGARGQALFSQQSGRASFLTSEK